jgi:aconitate hydratase
MIAAGLVAQKAVKFGLKSKPWVKTSLAPGSQVVTEYLEESGLQTYLDQIGFDLVGYGCTTCIGNSGPLLKPIEDTIAKNDLAVVSVLSGNRNFEGRIHPFVKANYLASPQLVVAYALAGTIDIDITKEPLGEDAQGKPIYLADIWPSREEVASCVEKFVLPKMFKNKYSQVFTGDASWQKINVAESQNYRWNKASTYINNPPYFDNMANEIGAIADIKGASLLAMFGDSITTDHISPAGNIAKTSPAGLYLQKNNVNPEDFNSYGARRGNHEVMMRGTFANIRLKNEMLPGTEGGITVYQPTKETMTIYDAAMKYQEINKPLIIVAGKEYGTGSSRDWAAKGTMLLGVKAVIAESFERIHRSNLVGMGVIPFTFKEGMNRVNLGLKGDEKFDIIGLSGKLTPGMDIECKITYSSGDSKSIMLHCRLDTVDEIEYVTNDGILPFVVHKLIQDSM